VKKSSFRFAALCALPLLVLFSGCVANIGSGSGRTVPPTIGQQLIDLQKARDGGAISEPEYEAQRAKLLSSPAGPPA
jgi:hypothetical protein